MSTKQWPFDNLDYRNTVNDLVDRVNNIYQYAMSRRNVFWESSSTLNEDYDLVAGKNAFAASPLCIANDVHVRRPVDNRIVVDTICGSIEILTNAGHSIMTEDGHAIQTTADEVITTG